MDDKCVHWRHFSFALGLSAQPTLLDMRQFMKRLAIFILVFSALLSYSAKADQWDGQLINVSANSGDPFDQRLLDAKKCAQARIKKYIDLFRDQLNADQLTTLNGMVSNLSNVTLRKVNVSANGPRAWMNLCMKENSNFLTPDNYTGYIVVCPSASERFGNMALCELLVHEAYHTTDSHGMYPNGIPDPVLAEKEAMAIMWQYIVMYNTTTNKCHYTEINFSGYPAGTQDKVKQLTGTPSLCQDSSAVGWADKPSK
jgi:hypothetical protein